MNNFTPNHFLFFPFLFVISSLFSQTWCDNGANWKYNYSSGFGSDGYVQISYIADTTILNKPCKKLKKERFVYYFPSSSSHHTDLAFEYTYKENNIVYILALNEWDTLYNFNAQIGESWQFPKNLGYNLCMDISRFEVIDRGTKSINGITLEYLIVNIYFEFDENTTPLTDTIIQKIGTTNFYMFPHDFCNGFVDAHEGGSFRCYSDDNFTTYKPNFPYKCDYHLGIEKLTDLNITIYPNPASNHISILSDLNEIQLVEITDLVGRKVLEFNNSNSFDVSNLSKGIYQVRIHVQNEIYSQQIVIQ